MTTDTTLDESTVPINTEPEQGGPTAKIVATINAPAIAAQQAAFIEENPDLELSLFTIMDANDRLARKVDELIDAVPELYEPGEATFMFTADETIDGFQLKLTIELNGSRLAASIGVNLARVMWEWMEFAAINLHEDPVGEHRRRHLEELQDMDVDLEMLEELQGELTSSICDFVRHQRLMEVIRSSYEQQRPPQKRGVLSWFTELFMRR